VNDCTIILQDRAFKWVIAAAWACRNISWHGDESFHDRKESSPKHEKSIFQHYSTRFWCHFLHHLSSACSPFSSSLCLILSPSFLLRRLCFEPFFCFSLGLIYSLSSLAGFRSLFKSSFFLLGQDLQPFHSHSWVRCWFSINIQHKNW